MRGRQGERDPGVAGGTVRAPLPNHRQVVDCHHRAAVTNGRHEPVRVVNEIGAHALRVASREHLNPGRVRKSRRALERPGVRGKTDGVGPKADVDELPAGRMAARAAASDAA